MSYNFKTGEVIGLEVEAIPANQRVRSSADTPTSLTILAEPVHLRFGVTQITVEGVRRDYDDYHGLADKPDEAGRQAAAERAFLDV